MTMIMAPKPAVLQALATQRAAAERERREAEEARRAARHGNDSDAGDEEDDEDHDIVEEAPRKQRAAEAVLEK